MECLLIGALLYGPWLPIYGCGGVLTLVLLNKYRDNPTLVFFAPSNIVWYSRIL